MKRVTVSADGETITVHIPLTFRKRGGRKLVVMPDGAEWAPRPRVDNAMVKALARAWSGSNVVGSVPYGTEAGIFRRTFGVPTVVCGPGDIAQAHQPNEFILKSQIDACETFMSRMVEWAERQ